MNFEKNAVSSNQNKENSHLPLPFLDLILRSVEDLRFGSIEIIVHDSKVVQVEIKEKVRFS